MANKKPEDFVNAPGEFDVITFEERYPPKGKILNNILEAVGNTPLVRLNKIPQSYGVKCEILAKCEYFNPGGSIKDRIAMRMVNDALKLGRLQKGGHLIEPTSGNTGVALGLVCAIQGYKGTVTVAEKNAGEKLVTMKALGLEMVKTPSVKWDDPRSYFSVAYEMSKNTPGAVTLNQYACISNALANYDQTGEEIVEQCGGKLDAIVMATGTGGTLTGIAAKVKEKIPTCKIVAADPFGSVMAQPDELNKEVGKSYKIEGMGHDHLPNTCVRKYVDQWIKTRDKESFDIARRLIKEEGLLIGGSCGSVLYAAIQYALEHNLDENQRIVVVFPDSIRNYMSKFASDDWMVDNGFYPITHYEDKLHGLYGKKVAEMKLSPIKTYSRDLTIKEAIQLLKGEDCLVIEENEKIVGAVNKKNLLSYLSNKSMASTETLRKIPATPLHTVPQETDLSVVSKLLERHPIVLVEGKEANQDQKQLYQISPFDLLMMEKNI